MASASAFLDEPPAKSASAFLDESAQPAVPSASSFLDEPVETPANPEAAALNHQQGSPEWESAYQADQALKNRPLVDKAAAAASTALTAAPYVAGAKGLAQFAGGLVTAPLHAVAQTAHGLLAAGGHMVGADNFAERQAQQQLTDKAESVLAGQQIEEGLRNTGRQIKNMAPAVALGSLGTAATGTPMAQTPDELAREDFRQRVETLRNQQQLAQGQPMDTGAVAGLSQITSGLNPSEELSPEALAEQGAEPASQGAVERMAAAANPENLALAAAPMMPGAKLIAGGGAELLGKAMQMPMRGLEALPGRMGATARAFTTPSALAAETGVGALVHPVVTAKIAGSVIAMKMAQKLGQIAEAAGNEFRTGAPGQFTRAVETAQNAGATAYGAQAARALGNAGVTGAATAYGMIPLNYAQSEGDPEKFVNSEIGAGIFGAGLGGLHTRASLRGMDAALQGELMAQHGQTQFTDNPAYAAHQDAMQKLSPDDQNSINRLRSFLWGGTGTDVLVVDGNTFAKAEGDNIGQDARGKISADGKTIYINADVAQARGTRAGTTPGQEAASTTGHEAGHAIVKWLSDASRTAEASALTDAIKNNLTPEQTQQMTDAYHQALLKSSHVPAGKEAETLARIQADNPPDKIIEENLSEITRNILAGKDVSQFALPKGIMETATTTASDFLQKLGIMPAVDPNASLGFKMRNVQQAANRMSDMLYEVGGKARAARAAGPTAEQAIRELRKNLADAPQPTPDMPAEKAQELAANRDALQKRLDTWGKVLGQQQQFPAQGRAPVPPSAPGIQTDPNSIAKADAVKGMVAMGIKPAEAVQHVNDAAKALGGGNASDLLAAAIKIRAGGTPTAATPGAPSNIERTGFNDQNGERHKITGVSDQPAQPGDFVVNQKGQIRRVVRVLANGGLDTVFPGTTNEQTTYPEQPGDYKVLAHEIETPNAPLPTSPTVAASSPVVPPEETPQTGNQTPAAVAVRPRVVPSIPGHPSGVPDIIDHILNEGGIVGKGKSPAAGTDQYADQPENSKRAVYNQIFGGTESPDDMARHLFDNYGIGDGSTSTMWSLIEKAIPERQGLAKQIKADEQKQKAQAKVFTQQEKDAARKVVSDAEQAATAAEKKPSTGAAKERIQRTKIKAIMDAIGDDPNGLHRVTDSAGQETIQGNFDPENPLHQELVKLGGGVTKEQAEKFGQFQDAQGTPVYIRYRSAKAPTVAGEGGEGTAQITNSADAARYKADPADQRMEGQPQHKLVVPIGTKVDSPSGKLGGTFLTVDTIFHNIASVFEGMKEAGIPNPYGETAREQEPQMVADFNAYGKNHANRWKGDGSAPIKGFPDSAFPKSDPNYQPTIIPKERFDVLNMAINDNRVGKLAKLVGRLEEYKQAGTTVPKSVMAQHNKAQEAYALAEENNSWIDHSSGETNELRAKLKAAGFDVDNRIRSPFETLSPKHILEVSDKPIPLQDGDIPSVRPTGFDTDPIELARSGLPNSKGAAAGFQPDEDTGLPEQGGTPGERLAREAEQAGVALKSADMKALMKNDQATMDRLRARIQQNTGKPARFQPDDFTLSNRSQKLGDKLVPVSIQQIDKAFSKDPLYVPPNGGSDSKREGVDNFLKTGQKIEAPEVDISDDGRVSFTDGRHRFAALRDKGLETMPLAMSPRSRYNARRFGLIAGSKPVLQTQ